jgi:NAD(P)-dependent dehydrogenase (short-subunit alcohol dehydrogenase family)
MARRLVGKIVCITGAASGIGRSTALLMAREGALDCVMLALVSERICSAWLR